MVMTKSKRAAVKKSSKKGTDAKPRAPRPVRTSAAKSGNGAAVPSSRVERFEDEGVHSVNLEDISRGAPAGVTAMPGGEPGRYVYGIIEASEPFTFGRSGLAGASEQVYTIPYNDIAAVVSKTNVFIFDPTRENALAHEHVIETVMKSN